MQKASLACEARLKLEKRFFSSLSPLPILDTSIRNPEKYLSTRNIHRRELSDLFLGASFIFSFFSLSFAFSDYLEKSNRSFAISAVSHAKSTSHIAFDAYKPRLAAARVLKNMLLHISFLYFLVYSVVLENTVYARLALCATVVVECDAPRYYVMHAIAPRAYRVAYGTNNKE